MKKLLLLILLVSPVVASAQNVDALHLGILSQKLTRTENVTISMQTAYDDGTKSYYVYLVSRKYGTSDQVNVLVDIPISFIVYYTYAGTQYNITLNRTIHAGSSESTTYYFQTGEAGFSYNILTTSPTSATVGRLTQYYTYANI
jgi:hypothetical protein